ncbi:hypothetical protein Pth03_69100 [Planotetraspora thailandica]|uniref:Uncharacterized protein n=1 Tax=Planotetraspora thailandica TaxID=487172 RepID=A0A8J3Y0H1_9ACTN|nr:hypothetical protein Pth03_69100 [Planotetraspora thailandica]
MPLAVCRGTFCFPAMRRYAADIAGIREELRHERGDRLPGGEGPRGLAAYEGRGGESVPAEPPANDSQAMAPAISAGAGSENAVPADSPGKLGRSHRSTTPSAALKTPVSIPSAGHSLLPTYGTGCREWSPGADRSRPWPTWDKPT